MQAAVARGISLAVVIVPILPHLRGLAGILRKLLVVADLRPLPQVPRRLRLILVTIAVRLQARPALALAPAQLILVPIVVDG